MKLFQFAIASIVDVNTGSGLPLAIGQDKKFAASLGSRPTLGRTLVDYMERLRSGISVARVVLRKRRELKRSLQPISQLSDHLLEDIGMSRGDVQAAEMGEIDLAELKSRHINNQDTRLPGLRGSNIRKIPENGDALNEEVFAGARCA